MLRLILSTHREDEYQDRRQALKKNDQNNLITGSARFRNDWNLYSNVQPSMDSLN
jgi:hypothetical protein